MDVVRPRTVQSGDGIRWSNAERLHPTKVLGKVFDVDNEADTCSALRPNANLRDDAPTAA